MHFDTFGAEKELSALKEGKRKKESASRAHAGGDVVVHYYQATTAACLIHLASCLPVVVSSFTLLQFVAVPRTSNGSLFLLFLHLLFLCLFFWAPSCRRGSERFSLPFPPPFSSVVESAILPICSNAKWQFNFSIFQLPFSHSLNLDSSLSLSAAVSELYTCTAFILLSFFLFYSRKSACSKFY